MLLLVAVVRAEDDFEAAVGQLRSPDRFTRHAAVERIFAQLDQEGKKIDAMSWGSAQQEARSSRDRRIDRVPWYLCPRYALRAVDAVAAPEPDASRRLLLELGKEVWSNDAPPESDELGFRCGTEANFDLRWITGFILRERPDVAGALLRDSRFGSKSEVLRDLGDPGNRGHLPLVTPFLRSPNPTLRAAAVQAVARIDGPGAREAVLAAMRDPRSTVRLAATAYLGNWRGPEEMEAWLTLLSDPQMVLREAAVTGLWDYQDPKIARVFLRLLETSERERPLALAGLRSHPSPEAVPALLRLRKSGREEAKEALAVLGGIDSPQARQAIYEAVEDPDEDLRETAVACLDEIRTTIAETALINALSDPSVSVVRAAIRGIERRKPRSAVPALRHTLRQHPKMKIETEAALRACLGLSLEDVLPLGEGSKG